MTTIRASNKLLLWIPTLANAGSVDCSTAKEAEKFYRETGGPGGEGARGDGSQWTCALV